MRGAMMLSLLVGVSAWGCRSAPNAISADDRPNWVKDGFCWQRLDALCSVGVKAGLHNSSLQALSSKNAARAELQKLIETFTASIDRTGCTSFIVSPEVLAEQAEYDAALQRFHTDLLAAIEVVEQWTDPADGAVHSLARVDLGPAIDSLQNDDDLRPRLREALLKSIDLSMKELHEEERRFRATR